MKMYYQINMAKMLQIWIYLCLLVLCKSNKDIRKLSIDLRHVGDIFRKQGKHIYTLSWAVEIYNNCQIEQITHENSSKCKSSQYYGSSLKNLNNLHQPLDGHCDNFNCLLPIKKIEPFVNNYIVAHPFFKIYNVFKKRKYVLHRRLLRSNSSSLIKQIKGNMTLAVIEADIFSKIENCINKHLKNHHCIKHFRQEILRERVKRSIHFEDPLFKQQWHLKNSNKREYDINVMGAWESGITGRGVTVCVVDDGLEWKNGDLFDNYNPRGSYDLNADDPDPSPVQNGERNEHGTRCAGEIAAVANNICGVGVAYRSNISGIRVLGDHMTDSMEARAFVQGLKANHIYSCSWGPNDDGKTIDGPHRLARLALSHGVTYGRDGYGAIYVVASGNGGKNEDNCNFDGYANSVFTITIGAVDSQGQMPYYAEECAAMLAVTPSSGNKGRGIVTTDWSYSSPSGCTLHHSGTSAAAPLASGAIALALEMQPCLSWRDIKYIIALTSRKIDVKNSDWVMNGAKLHHSHQHGFGLLDATGMVSVAAVWQSVPFASKVQSNVLKVGEAIPVYGKWLKVNTTLESSYIRKYGVGIIEYVQVIVTIESKYRGNLKIQLTCPSGTLSILASPRKKDNSTRGFHDWPLSTVRCWGEVPSGTYELKVGFSDRKGEASLVSWKLVVHGTPMTPEQFMERRSLARRAIRGEVIKVNRTHLCRPPETNYDPFIPMNDKNIKILSIISCFLVFMSLYNSLEYVFCYNDEKRKFYQHLRDIAQTRSMNNSQFRSTSSLSLGNNLNESNNVSNNVQNTEDNINENSSLMSPLNLGSDTNDTRQSIPLIRFTGSNDACGESSSDNYFLNDDNVASNVEVDRGNVSNNSNYLRSDNFCNNSNSPTHSCDADISSYESDEDILVSLNTDETTVVPRDTDTNTDFTTDLETDLGNS